MMSSNKSGSRIIGFVLLEAMIAVLILAVGLLALGQFQGRLMQTSGESKRTSEALYLAQQKVDELRSLPWDHGDLAVTSGTPHANDPVAGSNASFLVQWTVAGSGLADMREVTVVVREAVNGIPGNTLATLQTFIAEASEQAVLPLLDGDGILEEGKYIDPETGDVVLPPGAEPGGGVDGVYIVEDQDGNVEEIIDPDTGTALNVEDSGFARISGNLFVSGAQLDVDVDGLPKYRVSTSGNAMCRLFPGTPGNTAETKLSATDTTYRVLGYSCYVSDGWQGFIRASSRYGNTHGRDLCAGSHDERPVALFARAGTFGAFLDRFYSGYKQADGQWVTVGIRGGQRVGESEIGSVCDADADCALDDSLRNLVPGGHHFLATVLAPVVDAAQDPDYVEQCESAMQNIPAAYVGNPFIDNPAGFVCLTPSTCGFVTNTLTRFSTRFGGVFENPSNLNVTDSVAISGASCRTFGAFGNEGGAYWCALGSASSGQLRPSTSSAAFDPEQYYFSISGNDLSGYQKLAGVSANDLFIEKTLDFTNMDFAIASGDSVDPPTDPVDPDPVDPDPVDPDPVDPTQPPATAPTLTWQPPTGNNRSLVWSPGVSGADDYQVFRCTRTGNAPIYCTPDTSGTPIATTSNLVYSVSSANRETRCFAVRARNSAGTGPVSSRYCVHRHGNSYDWDP